MSEGECGEKQGKGVRGNVREGERSKGKCDGGHAECCSICDGRGEESEVMRGEEERVKGSVRGGDRSEGGE